MAGIIGERYIEISPGSGQALEGGSKVRGIDPPRIDQLLSQGYGVFGKVQDFIDQNEVTISEFLQNLNRVLKEANEIFKGKENPSKLLKLIANLNLVAEDVHEFSLKLKTKESTKFFEDLTTLVNRTEKIDEKALREFLQKEGVRVRVF
jgi:phospholipid/cholesterol/gamma-HCH transport system substrate-binding protein